MSNESAKIDANQKKTLLGVTNAATPELRNIKVDATTGRLLCSATVSGVSSFAVANEATDTTCFPLFVTAATGSLGPKTNAGLTFNSNTGLFTSTSLASSTSLTLGVAGGTTGSIILNGTTSGTVTIKTADAAGTYTLTLPTTDGDANQLLKTDGSGVLSWADAAGGVPTTITVADEATDTTCFVAFFTAATGDLGPKSNAGLTFNSNTGNLGATLMTTRKISLGSAGVATGSIEINGTTSGTVTLKTADAAGTYTLTLPTTDGDANQFLQTDGSGVLTWAAAGGGAIEGTAILSTGEVGGTKFLREDGDNTCSWQTVDLSSKADVGQTFYIGTTQVAINRASAALTLAGITLTAPTFDTSATGSYLTASEILITDADKKIVSAPVATYPSLTELAYVKGVSSAIQTQIGNKANSASPTFTGTITLADNCRIDLTLPTADTYCTGPTTDSFASGYSSAVGDLVFFGTGGKWLEADADAIATCGTLLGIALEAKADTEAMKVALPGSMVRLDAWNWNVGKCLYASETLGGISESIPTGADGVVKVVGVSLSADAIYFMGSPDHSTVVA